MSNKRYFALFYVAYPYYFPHFLPIYKELSSRGHKSCFVLSDKQNSTLMEKIAKENSLEYVFGESELFSLDSDYVFFANPYKDIEKLKAKTIFLEHGIGTKSNSFYPFVKDVDIYLAEGKFKRDRVVSLFPEYESRVKVVGYSKFDLLFDREYIDKESLYEKYGFDRSKKTILYAPTFFPSSIEKMSDHFPQDFKECNILVKAHYLTYERERYKKQRRKLELWNEYDNCKVVDVNSYDLMPFFSISDVMISDESSAMFEFAALNKPVISNRFLKLRASYYLMPWKLSKRIDKKKDRFRQMLESADSYEQMKSLVNEALTNPHKLSNIRKKLSYELCGEIDGMVSRRISDLIL